MKEKLRDLGFYVLSGQGNNLEVYAISDGDDYIEQKVTKIIDKVMAKYGGSVVYCQWAPIMKKILCSISLVGALLLSGCTQWKRLTGTEKKDDPVNINGVWSGTLQLDGQPANAGFIIVQNGATIVPEGFFSINYSQYGYVHLSGSVSGNGFSMTGSNGTLCPNLWYFSGEASGGALVMRIQTAGNDVPGTSCYPKAVDQTITLTH